LSTRISPAVFSILSSITPAKGQEMAIRALAEVHCRGLAAKLVIAGSGKAAYLEHCQKLVEDLGLSELVEFRGFVDDPYELYFTSDCLLICSDHEALSRAGLEALSTALPVIGKNSGGTPEIIDNEKTGLLYDTFDELVTAMIKVAENPAWARQLGLAGWQSARERFNIEDYAANVYQIIQSISKAPKA
jgi:glycosyltransferase involved in cell wall biosynthesis